MKKKLFDRSLSLLLTLLMIFSIFPTPVFADESDSTDTITVDVIAAKLGYDGWEILYPGAVDGTTRLQVPTNQNKATLYDAMMAIDPDATLRANNRISRLFGHTSGNDATWTGYIGTSMKQTPKTATLAEDNKLIFYYYDGLASRPDWDTLSTLIAHPNPVRTPAQRLSDLLASELSFDKIRGTNTAADRITANLALPSKLDVDLMSQPNFTVTWASSNTKYISNSGTIQARPRYGDEAVSVTMTATVTAGSAYKVDKYGPLADAGLPKTVDILLAVAPLTEAEENANKASVQGALAGIELSTLMLMDKDPLDPGNVLYDIQLVDPRNYGDKTTIYLSEFWSSDNPAVITVNTMRAKVTRPAMGQPDATVQLTVTAAKGGYSESKSFQLTVKAVTQAELDAANAELNAVAAALTFDVVKNANIAADAVTFNLKMANRGLDYPNQITFKSNNAEKGIKIEWESSDAGAMASYGTVNRPAAVDRPVTMTATLSAHRLATYLEPRTVQIPIVVRKVSTSADVASITALPSMGLSFDALTKTYNLLAPAIADHVAITVKTAETGTLITSGVHSARGTLSFDAALSEDQTTGVTITTVALDSGNTDTYVLNITREAARDEDEAVLALLSALSGSYNNTGNNWAAISLAALGMGDKAAGATIVENARDTFKNGSSTDLSRLIIVLTALGVDATNLYGGSESLYLNFVAKLGETAPLQAMEAVFGLLALDSGEYNDEGFALSRESSINFLLNMKLTPAAGQTAWAISGQTPDTDATAMAIAALAPYYDSNPSVKSAVDGALVYLSTRQQSAGHYGNSNATAMVVVALAALGKDPGAHTGDFAKGGKSLLDGLLTFRTDANQFGYNNNTTANPLSTEQGFRALVTFRGYLYAGNSAYRIYQFGPQTGDGTVLTGESDPGTIPPDPSTPKNIRVRVENLYGGKTLIPETHLKLSGTHLDALKAALTANQKDPATDLVMGGDMVASILGVAGTSVTGWMYAINGEIPVTALSQTLIAEGDELVVFFVYWKSDAYFFTRFDKERASIKEGQSLTLTLTGLNPWDAMGGGGVYAPMSGATVYAYDVSGNEVGEGAVTGADGKATLTFPTAGTYTISAKRTGSKNITDLVPPLCTLTVTASTPGSDSMTVYFTLQGLDGSSRDEIWIHKKTVFGVTRGATAADVVIKALEGTGYSQVGAKDGYVKSVTTPAGFTLTEGYNDMKNSGWLFKVNAQLPEVGIDATPVQDGDHVLLYFTKDYTKDPDAGKFSGTGSASLQPTAEVKVTATTGAGGTAKASADTDKIKAALNAAVKASEKAPGAPAAELRLVVTMDAKATSLSLNIQAEAVSVLSKVGRAQLIIESALGSLTFDADTLHGLIPADTVGSTNIMISIARVNADALSVAQKAIAGDSPVFDLSVLAGSKPIRDFDGKVTAFLPYTPAAGVSTSFLTVYYIGESGELEQMENVKYDAARGGLTFTTGHFSRFFIAAAGEAWRLFTDIKADDWFFADVKYAVENGLFRGTGVSTFSPQRSMTRGMLVTVLGRMAGVDVKKYTASSFKDVRENQFYAPYIAWANERGIVTGIDDQHFSPDTTISRQDIAAILVRYTQKMNLSLPMMAEAAEFSDVNAIADYAKEAVTVCQKAKIINGKSEGLFDPQSSTTRAEAVAILHRFFEAVQ